MNISVIAFAILISTYIVNASVLDPVIENVVHLKASKPPSDVPGVWKKKTIWKPRWVKSWKSAKVMKPVWRKVWSPVQIREWLPIPKPPPGWDFNSTPLAPVQTKLHQKAPAKAKGALNFGTLTVHSHVPLWDPVPYPESQQPPPLSSPHSSHITDIFCSKGECDSTSSQTFNQQQISEIVGPRYRKQSDYFQNPEYSETENHLVRLSPDENNWKPPPLLPNLHTHNSFNSLPLLPEFLIPPKFQRLPFNDLRPQPSVANFPVTPPLKLESQNAIHQQTQFPPENKIKGHFVTKVPDQSFEIQFPEVQFWNNNNTKNLNRVISSNSKHVLHKKTNSKNSNLGSIQPGEDFIQEAELVGEYHYSEFDLPHIKDQTSNSQLSLKEISQIAGKPHQKVNITVEKVPLEKEENQQLRSIMKNKLTSNGAGSNAPKAYDIGDDLQLQKKHETDTPSAIPASALIFQHKAEEISKKIFPIYEKPFTVNRFQTQSSVAEINAQSNSSEATINLQSQKKFHSTEQTARIANPIFHSPNHRFTSPSDIKNLEISLFANHSAPKSFAASSNQPSEPRKNDTVQVVLATTPVNRATLRETATTESYETIFSSSLLTTTEPVTKSPVIIVTPANVNKS